MFGYFRFNQDLASHEMKTAYKNYYCGTCFALEKHYGELSRIILSYDVVLLAIMVNLHTAPDGEQLPCFGKSSKKKQFADEGWRKIAAANILLFNAEIDDDLNDDNSVKAKAAFLAFKSKIKKAENDYPELARIIDEGYREMLELEKGKSDVLDICGSFSNLISNLLKTGFNADEIICRYGKAIAGWLYFIDQLDDYDDDIFEGKFNPLVIDGVSKLEYINTRQSVLSKYIETLMLDFDKIKSELDRGSVEGKILFSIINETIPSMTLRVMTNQKLPKLDHMNKREVKWSDS